MDESIDVEEENLGCIWPSVLLAGSVTVVQGRTRPRGNWWLPTVAAANTMVARPVSHVSCSRQNRVLFLSSESQRCVF